MREGKHYISVSLWLNLEDEKTKGYKFIKEFDAKVRELCYWKIRILEVNTRSCYYRRFLFFRKDVDLVLDVAIKVSDIFDLPIVIY